MPTMRKTTGHMSVVLLHKRHAGTTRTVCGGAGSMKRYDTVPIRLSVCLSQHGKLAAAVLMLWARLGGDIDRLLQQRRAASE